MASREKIRAQMKSRFYYMFWGAATLSVLAGQVLVGTGYRRMSDSMDAISADINLLVEVLTIDNTRPRGTYEPIIPPPSGDFNDSNNGVVYLEDLDPDDYIIWLETDKYTIAD